MKRTLTAAVLAVLGFASPVWAQQRPLVTEDPETIGSGNVLIEGGVDVARDILYPVRGLHGDLLRLPTIGVRFVLSSIAGIQIDGGIYNRRMIDTRWSDT